MTQVLAKNHRYLSEFRTLEESRAGREPGWLSQLRRDAISRFSELGFPTARRGNERWKYTNVAPVASATFTYPSVAGVEQIGAREVSGRLPGGDGWITLAFVNGRYSPAISTPPGEVAGVRLSNLADAIGEDAGLAHRRLASYASYEDDGFVALNTAFVSDGAFVAVAQDASVGRPLHLVYLTTNGGAPAVCYPRNLVVAGRHSRSTIVETYLELSGARGFTNSVTEIVMEEGAQLDHYRLLLEGPNAFHVGTTRVRQHQDSSFSSASFCKGAALARNDLLVVLDAPGASCSLRGLYMTSGKEHVDNFINIDHAKPHTTSRLCYKGILDGSSRAVFGGTVLVRKDAQKADAQQSDKNLLLSEEAEVDSKPSLLIYADDVKCGHGATAGHIDQDTLFYMMSRGLDFKTASALLIRGFASEIIDAVGPEALREFIGTTFLGALAGSHFGGHR